MKNRTIHGNYFYGNEISTYGKENGYVDYGTLGKAFNMILNNDIMQYVDDWEMINGFIDNSNEIEKLEDKIDYYTDLINCLQENIESKNKNYIDEQIAITENRIEKAKEEIEELEDEENYCNHEIFQYYIIDNWGAEILKNWTDEIVFYNEQLDMYIWGVTHFGTSWDYVLTDIKIGNIEK